MKKKIFCAIIFIVFSVLLLAACTEASKLSFAQDSLTVIVGEEITPEVKVYPKKFGYELSVVNETVASVKDGVVKGLKDGKTVLKAVSGKKTAECVLYVMPKSGYKPTDPIIKENRTVSFFISNYAEYGFKTGALEPYVAIDGSLLNVGEPIVHGYYIDYWYVDRECTVKYDVNTQIHSDFTLYAKISPRETEYNVVNGLIVGLLYKNLPHEKLILPEKTDGGEEITGIADEAFYGDETIKEITIPASYYTVGTSAFAGCKALEKVTFGENSRLKNIGVNAFGVCRDKDGNVTASCEALTTLNLPDTVSTVGAFAFYKCSVLTLNGIPSALKEIPLYAFSETLINKINFENVTLIYEGAFFNCSALDTVVGTENIVKCAKYAFDGTKLATDARAKYASDRKEPGFYAGTVLFGIYPDFGTAVGNGKYRIKEDTTLIADNALNGARQTELSLYIDTENAALSLTRGVNFLGENVFYKQNGEFSAGIFVVVGNGLTDEFSAKYAYGDDNYAQLFAEAETVTVAGDYNTKNFGKHVLLYRNNNYYYDRYIPDETGSARVIKTGDLLTAHPFDIVRINMNAFTGISGLKQLHLNKVIKIAQFAVVGCSDLEYVFLTDNNLVFTMPEHVSSLQFGGSIIVADNSYTAYKRQWEQFIDLHRKLKKYSEIFG